MTQHSAKRHHHVPQFYLRGFADRDRITTVELPGDQTWTKSVRKTAAENGFYAVRGHPDGDDAFEKVLSSIEGDASHILTRIQNGEWPLSPEDRYTLSWFVALQVTRGPEQRRNMDYLAASMTRMEIGFGGKASVKGWAKQNRGVDITDEEAEMLWKQATQPGGPPIRHSAIAHIEQMMEMTETLHPMISMRPWILIRFTKRSLITCDTPVTLVERADDDAFWAGKGFLTAQLILYPLTRKLGLLMGDPQMMIDRGIAVERVRDGEFDHQQEGTTAVEKLLNASTARGASLYIFHHPDDAKFVPEDLPGPRPVTMRLVGEEPEFTGEPYFAVQSDGEAIG